MLKKRKILIGITSVFFTVVFVCFVVLFIILLSIGFPIGGYTKRNYLWDYAQEYKFVLPFETKNRSYAGNLYFDTSCTYEQMQQKTIEAGYDAQLRESDGHKYILIIVDHDKGISKFLIRKIHDEERFMLTTQRPGENSISVEWWM